MWLGCYVPKCGIVLKDMCCQIILLGILKYGFLLDILTINFHVCAKIWINLKVPVMSRPSVAGQLLKYSSSVKIIKVCLI